METTEGYEFEVVNESDEDYECPVCLMLLKDPMELPCVHCICKTCLKRLEKERNQKICPLCQENYQEDQVTRSRFLEKKVRTGVKVKCKQHKMNCQWTGMIVDYEAHENTCECYGVECPFDGCDKVVMRKDLENHQNTCLFRSVQCPICKIEERFNKFQEHYQICPNYGCTSVLCHEKINEHKERFCQEQEVVCDYSHVGCQKKIKRKFQINHNKYHMFLLLQELTKVKSELNESKQRLEVTINELEENKKQLARTKKRLKDKEMFTIKIRYDDEYVLATSDESDYDDDGDGDDYSDAENVLATSNESDYDGDDDDDNDDYSDGENVLTTSSESDYDDGDYSDGGHVLANSDENDYDDEEDDDDYSDGENVLTTSSESNYNDGENVLNTSGESDYDDGENYL